jgi:hypothetical protein
MDASRREGTAGDRSAEHRPSRHDRDPRQPRQDPRRLWEEPTAPRVINPGIFPRNDPVQRNDSPVYQEPLNSSDEENQPSPTTHRATGTRPRATAAEALSQIETGDFSRLGRSIVQTSRHEASRHEPSRPAERSVGRRANPLPDRSKRQSLPHDTLLGFSRSDDLMKPSVIFGTISPQQTQRREAPPLAHQTVGKQIRRSQEGPDFSPAWQGRPATTADRILELQGLLKHDVLEPHFKDLRCLIKSYETGRLSVERPETVYIQNGVLFDVSPAPMRGYGIMEEVSILKRSLVCCN